MNAYKYRPNRGWTLAATCVALVLSASAASAALFDQYAIVPGKQFTFPDVSQPGKAQGPTLFDALSDGRLALLTTRAVDSTPFGDATAQLFVETALGSRSFSLIGTLPDSPNHFKSYGASFFRVSPDGGRIAIGDNNGDLGLISTATLTPGGAVPAVAWYPEGHYDAVWTGANQLLVSKLNSSFSGSEIESFDITNPLAPVRKVVVDGIQSSAGVAVDNAGNLFTAEGFDQSGTTTGQIREFPAAVWQAALAGSPANFAGGALVAQYLGAGVLAFDSQNNLLVGSGDFNNYPASNGVAIFPSAGGAPRIFDPNTTFNSNGDYYAVVYNKVTGEIYVNEPFPLDFSGPPRDNRLVYVIASVPEPASAVLLAMGSLGAGWFAWRRRGARVGGSGVKDSKLSHA